VTAAVTLGTTPITITVVLPLDADFPCELVAEQDWPEDAGIELRFHTDPAAAPVATWTATVSGNAATWDVAAALVQAVIDAGATTARLHYIEPDGTDLLWGRGRVRTV
jgi:hypothetical protein